MSQLVTAGGRVGELFSGTGSLVTATMDTLARFVTALASGKYAEAVRQGRCWQVSSGATGVTPGTALGATAAIAVQNPLGSGVAVRILKASFGYFSGTLGAGTLFYAMRNTLTDAAISGGTALTPQNCLVGGPQDSTTLARVNATLAGTPTALRPALNLDAGLASTVGELKTLQDDLDGEITLLPGATFAMEAIAAAGTAPLIAIGVMYERFPLPPQG